MEKTAVQKLAGVLKILVTIAFVCNLLVLPLVPGLVGINLGGGMEPVWELASNGDLLDPLRLVAVFFLICWQALWRIWREVSGGVLTVFLWLCGACTAIILWQARRVLNTILAGNPFQRSNAGNLRRAAVCCLVISAAALARLIWGFAYYRSLQPLFTYNALFVPLFAMGFLLCMVMSALFRQAAELKEENDLTI